MRDALKAFDAACAAGDQSALEFRAYALAALERYAEAAETLDALMGSLPPELALSDAKKRLAEQLAQVLGRVATLNVATEPENAEVLIDGKLVGRSPLRTIRLSPGPHRVDVVTLTGDKETLFVELLAGVQNEYIRVSQRAVARREVDYGTRAPAQDIALRSWSYVVAASGVCILGMGIGMTVWAQDRKVTYEEHACNPSKVGCADTMSEFELARALQIGAFVAAGAALVTAGTLFVVSRPAVKKVAAFPCTIFGSGLSCRFL